MLLFIGGIEIAFILLFIVLFFGTDKIPDLARSMGRMVREVKDASNEIKREIKKTTNEINQDSKNDD